MRIGLEFKDFRGPGWYSKSFSVGELTESHFKIYVFGGIYKLYRNGSMDYILFDNVFSNPFSNDLRIIFYQDLLEAEENLKSYLEMDLLSSLKAL